MEKGLLIVLSGPSGTGKGTVCKALLKDREDLCLSVSCTTRKPRACETEGINYYFKSGQEFEELIKQGEFLEYAKIFSNYYGTPRSFVESKLFEGKDVLLEIDVQGALMTKRSFPDGVFLFLIPPSMEELELRIRRRGTEDEQQILTRLGKAGKEMALMDEYDYVIVNDHIDKVVKSINCIIRAEKLRVSRNKDNFKYFKEW
ncbi:MAG: guanylate kinase [Christensenellales bacterium]|jgi:guanylate kinase